MNGFRMNKRNPSYRDASRLTYDKWLGQTIRALILPSAALTATYQKAASACQEMNSFVLLASKENLDLPSL
jgi:hypothetical protein